MRKFSALTFAVLLFGQFATTWADPPAGRGNGIGASQSTLQRAVDSRAGLQQRVNLGAQSSANGGVGVGGSGAGQNSANTNGNIGVSANIQADANGSANAQSGTGRLPREVVTRRLLALRNQQSVAVRNATRTEFGIGNAPSSDTPTPSNKKPPRGKSGTGSDPNSNEDSDSSSRSGLLSLNGSARSEIVANGQNRLALTNADKLLAQRLVQIDQMRDRALESGNDQMLDQADRLELAARTHFAEQLAADTNGPASQAGANAQGQATGATRGRVNQSSPQKPNSRVPTEGRNNSDNDANTSLLSSDAAAATQNEAAASLNNKARRTNERTRRETNRAEPDEKVRNASLSGQANSANAADTAAGDNSFNATGNSTTKASANTKIK